VPGAVVYNLEKNAYERTLSAHRESVRCLVLLPVGNGEMFASASLDGIFAATHHLSNVPLFDSRFLSPLEPIGAGAIIIWQSETCTMLRVLTCPDKYRNEQRMYVYCVRALTPLGERFLAAAFGHSFAVWDVLSGQCVLQSPAGHEADITALIPLYDGTHIVTASSDRFALMCACAFILLRLTRLLLLLLFLLVRVLLLN
jgi:WD40 repeat protein